MRKENLNPFGVVFHIDSFGGLDVDVLHEALLREKLIVVRGLCELQKEEFLNLVLKFSKPSSNIEERLLHWSFGPVMELQVDPKPENYLFSTENVPFHWDGAFHREPSYLAFNCLLAPEEGCGGETLFCDTEKIYQDLAPAELKNLESCQLTYQTEKKAHYGGEVTVPILQKHPKTGVPILRYAEAVETELNPVKLKVAGLEGRTPEEFQKLMKERIYGERYCYQHRWQKDDILLVDNFATIHGRNAFTKNTPRHIRRIQVL